MKKCNIQKLLTMSLIFTMAFSLSPQINSHAEWKESTEKNEYEGDGEGYTELEINVDEGNTSGDNNDDDDSKKPGGDTGNDDDQGKTSKSKYCVSIPKKIVMTTKKDINEMPFVVGVKGSIGKKKEVRIMVSAEISFSKNGKKYNMKENRIKKNPNSDSTMNIKWTSNDINTTNFTNRKRYINIGQINEYTRVRGIITNTEKPVEKSLIGENIHPDKGHYKGKIKYTFKLVDADI